MSDAPGYERDAEKCEILQHPLVGRLILFTCNYHDPVLKLQMTRCFINGMHEAGIRTSGKHFTGRGAVSADLHKEIPHATRRKAQIHCCDMPIFQQLIAGRALGTTMPAHVFYTEVGTCTASSSAHWLQKMLHNELGFDRAIFSDDLSMAGAAAMGNYAERGQALPGYRL